MIINDLYSILNELKPNMDFSNLDDLVDKGILESYDIITLVAKIEEYYKISIDVFDIIPSNFKNADAIFAMIKGYIEHEPA